MIACLTQLDTIDTQRIRLGQSESRVYQPRKWSHGGCARATQLLHLLFHAIDDVLEVIQREEIPIEKDRVQMSVHLKNMAHRASAGVAHEVATRRDRRRRACFSFSRRSISFLSTYRTSSIFNEALFVNAVRNSAVFSFNFESAMEKYSRS